MNVPGPKLSAIPSEIRSCAADPESNARMNRSEFAGGS